MKLIYSTYAFVFFFILSVNSYSQADFFAIDTEGCDSLYVRLIIDYNTIDITLVNTAVWEVNGRVISTEVRPSTFYVYASDTTLYTVKLTINDTAEIVKQDYIKVYESLIAGIVTQETNDKVTSFAPAGRSLYDFDDNYVFAWYINGVLEQSGNSGPFLHEFADTGYYQVQLIVSNNYGCTNTASKSVHIEGEYYFPNILFPNRGEYILYQFDGITPVLFQVYTRTGVKIYESEAPSIQWNGVNLTGNTLHTGVYYYTISTNSGENDFNHAGFIHIYSN